MSPLAQLLLRHQDAFERTPPSLWVNPPADLPSALLEGGGDVFCQDESLHIALQSRGVPVAFGTLPPHPDRSGPMVLSLPREKERLRMMAAALASIGGAERRLLVAGELRAGGRSMGRHLETAFRDVRKLDSARHCVLFEASSPLSPDSFSLSDWFRDWRLGLPGGAVHIRSLPGVFAHGELDAGTALLLDLLPELLSRHRGRILDLGCGAGVIGAAALHFEPDREVTLADSNALALASSAATLAANGQKASCVASNGLSALRGAAGTGARFGLLLSNPPFHDGHREREDRGAGVFDGVQEVLEPSGTLIMVVNRHLPWPQWLDQQFGQHEVLTKNDRYQVLRARNR